MREKMKKAGALHRKFKLQEGGESPGQVCQGSGVSTSGTLGSQASLRAVGRGSAEGINWEPLIGFHTTSQGCCYR